MFRFETLAVAVLLSSPVAALWLRGDFTDADVLWRFGLAWLVAWAAVTLLTAAARPLAPASLDNTEGGDDEDDRSFETNTPGDTVVAPPAPAYD